MIRAVDRLRRPTAARFVLATGEDGLAVRAEGHGEDRTLMMERLSKWLACCGVPEPCDMVVAAGQNGLAVGAEGRGSNGTLVGKDPLE